MQSTISPAVGEQEVLKSLAQQFATLTDHRQPRGLRYELTPLLVLIVLAKLCGANNPLEIARWVEYRAAWLTAALGLEWKRMPHHATYRRVLQSAIDLSHFESQAGQYLRALADESSALLLNMDGKSLRGTIPKRATQGLRLLAVQRTKQNAVVSQTAIAETENEISAAKRLLKKADLQGTILSGDAIFAQQELSRQVIQGGGDYLWKVKANQAGLLNQIKSLFEHESAQVKDLARARSLDKGHGRIEERVLTSSSRLADQVEWPYLGQVFTIRSDRLECQTQKRSVKTHYGITSLGPMEADAQRLLELTRAHWSIENGLHYRRDVTFKEDACRMKSHTAAEALAVCNNLAVGLIRHAGWDNVAEARRYYDAYPAQALRLIVKPPD
ncbi:MAG: ISAs1 family transposase [Pyrinomonadaceae bacterium]